MSSAVLAATAPALDDAGLRQVLQQRLSGDRTGACFAAAVIDGAGPNVAVARAVVCADADKPRSIDADTAFEIGSVSKTMTAALAAGLIADGKLDLDDPLSKYLPSGATVPDFKGQPILLRHLMTHTSGLPSLPSRMSLRNAADPYAALTAAQLYGSLADARLAAAPGAQFAYSNYAMMMVSDIVARQAGQRFDRLIQSQMFAPLAMTHSFVGKPPKGTRVAIGHLQTGAQTPPWNFPVNFAGVGGVRSSLNDMVHYVEAELGRRSSSLDAALALTQKQLADVQGTRVAMNWMLIGSAERTVHAHEGGTGGFSSLVAFDRGRGRGVVILSDTALTSIGGLGRLGMHLLDGSVPLESARRLAAADAGELEALAGDYLLDGGLRMKLSRQGQSLVIQATGQPPFVMGHDSAGDYFPMDFDAVLRPSRHADGSYSFIWLQGGGAMQATRLSAGPKREAITLSAEARAEYPGDYPLLPGFVLAVIDRDGALYVQGTGQSPIEVVGVGDDTFVAESVGAEIHFERDANGRVIALELRQAGQTMRGARQ